MTAGQSMAFEAMMPIYGFDYQDQVLDLTSLFGNDHPITLEIGFGMGASLAEQAANHPNLNFIGIEVHRPGVGALLLRMKEMQLTNIRVISHDAIEVLNNMISDNGLHRLQLFFPDPWHKRKHHKRRIVNQEFADLVAKKLVTGGILHMATDWQDYAEQMLKVMNQAKGWYNCSATNDYVPKPDERPVTKFQQRGEGLGHGVWDLMFKRLEHE